MDESNEERLSSPKRQRKRDRVRRFFKKGSPSNVSSDEDGKEKERPVNYLKRKKALTVPETGEDTTTTDGESDGEEAKETKRAKVKRLFRRKGKDTRKGKGVRKGTTSEESGEESTESSAGSDDEGSSKGSRSQKSVTGDSDQEESSEAPSRVGVAKALHEVDDPGDEIIDDVNKKREYQIRVRVIEAKELEGENLNPVCRVHMGSKTRSTRVKHATENPKWEQTLFSKLKVSLEEMSEKKIEFKIYNARRMRGDNLIGGFSCNLALIYRQKGHAIINRWLALTRESEEQSDTGVCGHVKVCASVLGPGQKGPSLNVRSSVRDDVESNVLFGGAAQFRTLVLQIRVLELMDLPILPQRRTIFSRKNRKEDSYNFFVQISVGGQSATTKLCPSDAPHVFQELRLPIKWPSVASFILIQVFGSRKPNDKIPLGAIRLRFKDICFPGTDGFLPCFGPAYLNFYGSESSLTKERHSINLGTSETPGNEYHGRILLHVTSLADHADNGVGVMDLGATDMMKLAPQIRATVKHTLFASFFAASMIAPEFKTENVCFEISTGAYGNQRYPATPPSASRTTAYMPMYDNNTYYCMPWGSMKPCGVVPCPWLDYSYRIRVSNSFEMIAEELKARGDGIFRKMGSSEDDKLEIASHILDLLDSNLRQLRSVTLEVPVDFIPTELDLKLVEIRRHQVEKLQIEMEQLRDRRISVEAALEVVGGFSKRIQDLAKDPQIGIPDVSLWMLVNGERKAFARIPAKDCFFLPDESGGSGRICGKMAPVFLNWPSKREQKSKSSEAPVLLHVKLFLTTDKFRSLWENMLDAAKLKYFAETFENESRLMGVWSPTSKRPPKFSDENGRRALPMDAIKPPPSWKFRYSKFKVSTTHDVWVDPDTGHEKFEDEVYEVQKMDFEAREWVFLAWTDFEGNSSSANNQFKCPVRWRWTEEWKVDLNCPGDDEGFTYQTDNIFTVGFEYAERVYHAFRRRRWIRKRIKTATQGGTKNDVTDGWEYAVKFGRPTHHRLHPEDHFRRRRWQNEMVPATDIWRGGDTALYAKMAMRVKQIKEAESGQGSGGESDVETGALFTDIPPRVYVVYDKVQRWELRAYIIQGRDMFPATRGGKSSTFVRLSFMNRCQESQVVPDVVNPIWNQTLIFGKIMIPGGSQMIKKQPPHVQVEVYHDEEGRMSTFLGRFLAPPSVCLGSDISDRTFGRDEVKWFPCELGVGKCRGDVLAAFELFEADDEAFLPSYPFKKNNEEIQVATKQSAEEAASPIKPIYAVPKDIRPEYVSTNVDFLCWGVRNLRRFQLFSVKRPFVEVTISNQIGMTNPLTDAKKNPNFDSPVVRLQNVLLPKQIGLAAPITLSLIDTRMFGRKPVVGVCLIKDFRKYLRDKPTSEEAGEAKSEGSLYEKIMAQNPVPHVLRNDVRASFDESGAHEGLLELDWWCKYYASLGERKKSVGYLEAGYEPIEVLDSSLEEVPHYDGFSDFCDTFTLHKVGKGNREDPTEEQEFAGELKGRLFIYRNPSRDGEAVSAMPPLSSCIPGMEYLGPTSCTIRVYIIRGDDLASLRRSGKADPYVEVKIGKKRKQKARNRARWDTLNPVFGETFEFSRVSLPQDKNLKVTVKDRRRITADGEIGSTVIDLENRLLTKWRATVGLPSQFNTQGPYVWRDQQTPMQILRAYCRLHKFPPPKLLSADKKAPMRITLGSEERYEFTLKDLEVASAEDVVPKNVDLGEPHQRLALHILRRLALVPEHVETRRLYTSGKPDTEQGKIQMWVDIFPADKGALSPSVDVSPRVPRSFQLRVVVWSVSDAILERRSFGEKSGDFYVKCFINGHGKGRKTDVHYRCLDGQALFNWRMIFNFDYDPWEKSIVVKKRRFFWQRKREERVEPELVVQLWDNHKFGRDLYLGQIRLNLLRCEEGQVDDGKMANVKKGMRRMWCGRRNEDQDEDRSAKKVYVPSRQRTCLFEQSRTNGWWPVMRGGGQRGREVTGKVNLEMNLLPGSEASKNQVGKGRKQPNMDPILPEPKRPKMDRHWLTSRIKGIHRRVWRGKAKWCILALVLVGIVLLIIVALIFAAPHLIKGST